MKTLTLVRHAKSSWDQPGLADFDRPLNQRGRDDAPAAAARFAHAFPAPGRILSSPALRALETARAFARALEVDADAIVADRRIYAADTSALLSVLREQPDSVSDLVLVGHSPAVADLGRALCGSPEGKFPTCAILRMSITANCWGELAAGDGDLVVFDRPKRPVLARDEGAGRG